MNVLRQLLNMSKITITDTITHLVYPPTFDITIISNFSWVLQLYQEKSKTMIMQNVEG